MSWYERRNDAFNNNSLECSQTMDNAKIGLLTLSDYINASLDQSCAKLQMCHVKTIII